MNIFNWFKKRKETNRKRKEQNAQYRQMQAIAVVFETLNKFKQSGLLYVDFKHGNVTISNTLAQFYVGDEAVWQNFLHNVHQWAVYQYSVSEYVRLYHKAQADAEAKAYAHNHAITSEERAAVRMKAAETFDDEQVQKQAPVPDLQFIVLGASDGRPIVIAKRVNGEYITAPVPEELKP